MRAVIRLLAPTRRLAAAFFSHDLSVRRGERGFEVALEARRRDGAPRPPTRAEITERRRAAELQRMLDELDALLAECPRSRAALNHLEHVGQALGDHGLGALDRLPLDVLQTALEQFEARVTNWSPTGLAALRSKIAVAIIEREPPDDDGADGARAAAGRDAGPSLPRLPEVHGDDADDSALAAAYAALGDLAPPATDSGRRELPA